MRIKKHVNKNEYLLTENKFWVRNFCKKHVKPIDINDFTENENCKVLIENEFKNLKKKYAIVENEHYNFSNLIIVSDGCDFINKQELLCQLPTDTKIVVIGTNGVLSKWKLTNSDRSQRRGISCYITNNPYVECLSQLPKHKYYPPCIASSRTNPDFLEAYKNNIHLYSPTPNQLYAGLKAINQFYIDDYKNPICAAIHLAYKFSVSKLLLFCCDDSFEKERPGAIQLKNKLWTYPAQITAQQIIDGMLYWLKKTGAKIGNHSNGIELNNATYISEDNLLTFFKEEEHNE